MARVGGAGRGAFVLIGFMGAGKSTAAAELAAALGVTPLDSDVLLAERLGEPIAAAFGRVTVSTGVAGSSASQAVIAGDGERAFRAAEEELVCDLLAQAAPGAVIALGGGSVLSERVRRALGDHVVVLLDVDAEEAWRRVSAADGGAERPLARDREAFLVLHAERQALYEELADAYMPALDRGTAAQALGALRALSGATAGTRMVWATSASGDYPVLIGRGLLSTAEGGGLLQSWPIDRSLSRPFCVSDETVAALYGDRLGELAGSIAIAPGEEQKTLASAQRVWQALIAAGLTRADHLVAVGGGVVGDLAGFCAATYQRGVPIVHVPTTLLAQVDSAYGGKTGVDLPQAKNYIGSYHQPMGVLVDPDTLATLPAAELAAGWVEVLKTALIAGGPLWESVAAGGEVDDRTILACVRTKLAIVAADERDAGQRQILNLGHTVGHAIETATGYKRYRHGEAVGLGLLAALHLSGAERLREQVRELLVARALPVTLAGASTDDVVAAAARDKKRTRSSVPFVLAYAPGDARIDCEVAPADLRAAVQELMR